MTASKDEQRELEALLEWLQTFPKFAETYQESEEQENDNNDDKLAIFGQIRPALAVYRVTSEICGKSVKEFNETRQQEEYKDVAGVWGFVFQLLSSPPLLQRIVGKRLSESELRFVLLKELPCRAVDDACPERRTYIGRILQLPQGTQESLRGIIERTMAAIKSSPARRGGTTPRTPSRRRSITPQRQVRPQEHHQQQQLATNTTPRRRVPSRSCTPRSFPTPATPTRETITATTPTNTTPRNTNSLLSISPRWRRRFSPSDPSADPKAQTDLLALMAWIRTFPDMTGIGPLNDIGVLGELNVALLLLKIAEQVCEQEPTPVAHTDVEDVWIDIQTVVSTVMEAAISLTVSQTMSLPTKQLSILTAMLCFAVSEDNSNRKTYIGRILRLPREMQHRLMRQIGCCRRMMDPTAPAIGLSPSFSSDDGSPLRPRRDLTQSAKLRHGQGDNQSDELSRSRGKPPIAPFGARLRLERVGSEEPCDEQGRPLTPGTRRSLEEAFGNHGKETPPRKRAASRGPAMDNLFSPTTIEGARNEMVQDLHRQNESLQRELEENRQRDAPSTPVAELKLKKEMIKIESDAMRQMEEVRQAHQKEIAELQGALDNLLDSREKEMQARKEVESLRDELDVLQHSKERLSDLEEKYRKCRERLEELADVKDALKREEEAHNESVSARLALENELKALQPLKRQLAEYKDRAVEAEVQLVECQDNLKKLELASHSLDAAHKDVIKGALMQQEETEEMRRQLSKVDDKYAVVALGEGVSELNPQVREELETLRNENARLREFADKREYDEVQKMEERLDDAQRLSTRFKEQFLNTKDDLERTQALLQESIQRELQLKEDVQSWTEKWSALREDADRLEINLGSTKTQLAETENLLKESEEREANLQQNVEDWTGKANAAEALAGERLQECQETRKVLDETVDSLLQSKERESALRADVDEWTEKHKQSSSTCDEYRMKLEKLEQEYESKVSDLHVLAASEATLIAALEETETKVERLNQELEEEQSASAKAKEEATTQLEQTRASLEEKRVHEVEELQQNMNMLLSDERQAYRNQLAKATTEYETLEKASSESIDKIKNEMEVTVRETQEKSDEALKQAEEKFRSEIEDIKKQNEKDRDALMQKGKTMLKEAKSRAAAEIKDLEDELQDVNDSLETLREEKKGLESRAKAKFDSFKHQLSYAQTQINELSQENDDLEDAIRASEREKMQLLDDNDRFRRQLGGRYGADGKVQNQLEMMQKEFNALLDENRELKSRVGNGSRTDNALATISEVDPPDFGQTTSQTYGRGGVGHTTLTALREEYEEQLQTMNDEKRELVMKNSAAVTDVQKAEQRSWELEQELASLKEELTSTKLELQRAEMRIEEEGENAEEQLGGENDENENALPDQTIQTAKGSTVASEGTLLPVISHPIDPIQTPPTVLSPTSRHNAGDLVSLSFDKPIEKEKTVEVTLMDLTSRPPVIGEEGPQECKQS